MPKTDEYLQERIKWRARQHKLPTANAFYLDQLSNDPDRADLYNVSAELYSVPAK